MTETSCRHKSPNVTIPLCGDKQGSLSSVAISVSPNGLGCLEINLVNKF